MAKNTHDLIIDGLNINLEKSLKGFFKDNEEYVKNTSPQKYEEYVLGECTLYDLLKETLDTLYDIIDLDNNLDKTSHKKRKEFSLKFREQIREFVISLEDVYKENSLSEEWNNFAYGFEKNKYPLHVMDILIITLSKKK